MVRNFETFVKSGRTEGKGGRKEARGGRGVMFVCVRRLVGQGRRERREQRARCTCTRQIYKIR